MSLIEHEGSDYAGFSHNEPHAEYEEMMLAAYERTSPLSSNYRPTENSTVEEDLENIAEFSDDDGYVEHHHPLPTSLGGTKGTKKRGWVTIKLTFAEHFRARELLIDFTEGNDRRKMLHALGMMGMTRDGRVLTPEQYAIARRAHIEAQTGRKPTPEARANLSAALRGRTFSPERRAAMCGKIKTPETCKKISSSLSGQTRSSETRAKISATLSGRPGATRGKPRSAETRAKLRAAQLGRKHTLEHREANRAAHLGKSYPALSIAMRGKKRGSYKPRIDRGRSFTPEHRAALRAAMNVKVKCPHCHRQVDRANYGHYHGARCGTRIPFSEHHRAAISDANRDRKHTLETRAKMSMAHLGKKRSAEARLSMIFSRRLGAGSMQRIMNVAETVA